VAGLGALLVAGAVGAGLVGVLQLGGKPDAAVVPAREAVPAAAPARGTEAGSFQAATAQYRAAYDRTAASAANFRPFTTATEQYQAAYGRTLAANTGMQAIQAATAQYRAAYDATLAARPRPGQ